MSTENSSICSSLVLSLARSAMEKLKGKTRKRVSQLKLRMRAKTYYVIFSTGYQVSKGKMRKTEEFSEEFSVLSENSSPAPHCSSLDLIGQFRLGQPLMILTPGVRILVLVLICSSLDLIGQFRLGQPLMILTPKMRILILVLICSSSDLIGQFWLGEANLMLTIRMSFLILVLICSSFLRKVLIGPHCSSFNLTRSL